MWRAGRRALDNTMERTRFFRRPWVWLVVVIIGAIALSTLFSGGPSYTKDNTSTDKIQAQLPATAIDDFYKDANAAKAAGKIDGPIDTKVSKDSVLLGVLVNLLPIAVLVILLLLFMSQMQGGGSRVLNFGKSKAKL